MKTAEVFVDSKEAAMVESGDVILSGCEVCGVVLSLSSFLVFVVLTLRVVQVRGELGEVISGAISASEGSITVFKSLGMAIEDVESAWLVYQAMNPSKKDA